MTIPIFKSFWPTTNIWHVSRWMQQWKAIVHDKTGSVVGIQSQNANGPDGIWAPVPLTAAQIASPTPAMLADLNATYQLDSAPYTRYRSDSTQMISLDASGEAGTVIPAGIIQMLVSPLVIYAGAPLTIFGGIVLVSGT